MRRLLVAAIFVLASWAPFIASAHGLNQHTQSPPPPADGQTIGERNPIVAIAAAVGIILTGAAGIYIYRIIKKGL